MTSIGNFSSTVTFTLSRGLPIDSIGMITPNPVTPAPGLPAVSELTIMTTAGTPTGTYNITIVGSSTTPYIIHSAVLSLVVVPSTHDFVLSTSQESTPLIVGQGQCSDVVVSVQAIGSFNSSISLFLSSTPPSDLTAQIYPKSVAPPMGGNADSNLRICVGPQANPAKYSMTIIANANDPGGTLVHSTDIILEIFTYSTNTSSSTSIQGTQHRLINHDHNPNYSSVWELFGRSTDNIDRRFHNQHSRHQNDYGQKKAHFRVETLFRLPKRA